MPGARSWRSFRVATIGHSTRSLEELVSLLRSRGVTVLVDVRTVPRSRHNPQFDRDVLARSLRNRRLRYVHLPELGGLRRPLKDSPNTAWRNAGFRGFADHMLTPEFEAGLSKLRELASGRSVALMCAEAVPWRCHRSLIADALTARGARVEHITGPGHAGLHRMTPFARVEGTRVTYPGSPGGPLPVRAPFHLEATVRLLQRRPATPVDLWDGETYLRVLPSGGGLALASLVNRGSLDAPRLAFGVSAGEMSGKADIETALRRILGLDVDPAPLRRLAEIEPRLAPTAAALRGMRPPRFPGLFETFARVIPFQQVSLDAGVSVVRRLVLRFGAALEHGDVRHHAFPSAAAVAGARLDAIRACGLSGRKAEALRGVARAIAAGQLTEEQLAAMDSAAAARLLTELPGIGPWSAGLVLLRGLGRLDVFPGGDVGVAAGLRRLIGVSPGRALERLVRRAGDDRGWLYFCALGGALLARGLIRAAPDAGAGRA